MTRFSARFRLCVFLVAAACRFFLSMPAHAVLTQWSTTASGLFTDPFNWSNGVPDGNDIALFNRGFVAYEVIFPGSGFDPPLNYSILDLIVATNEVSFVWDQSPFVHVAPTLTVLDPNLSIIIGESSGDVSILNMAIGRLSGANASIGALAGANGTLNVGGTFNMSGSLHVGDSGTGTMNVTGGGRVESFDANLGRVENSVGHATVSGANSQWINSGDLYVGNGGTGTLTIQNGASVSAYHAVIGDGAQSNSTATVTGAGSAWTMELLSIGGDGFFIGGEFGAGTLRVENGGVVTVGNGTGLVQLATGKIGNPSQGLLQIGNGGAAGMVQAAEVHGGLGAANVVFNHIETSYSFTPQLTGSVSVRHEGPGATELTAATTYTGSTLVTAGKLNVQQGLNGGGNVTVNGGHLEVMGGVTANGDTIRLESGVLSADSISLASGGAFNFLGGKLHVDTFSGSVVNQGGTLAPGRSAGNTTILGDYTQQTSATLEIEIGGTSPGATHDLVSITGNAILDGELQLSLINGFVPAPGETFTVLSTSVPFGIVGVFANVATGERLATVDGLGSFVVNYGAGSPFNQNQVILTAFELSGDYNDNGVVDAADYVVWRNTLGQTGSGLAADGNGNNQIDPGDYTVWRAHFGQTAGAGATDSSSALVPEPASLLSIWIGAVALACGRRRRSFAK